MYFPLDTTCGDVPMKKTMKCSWIFVSMFSAGSLLINWTSQKKVSSGKRLHMITIMMILLITESLLGQGRTITILQLHEDPSTSSCPRGLHSPTLWWSQCTEKCWEKGRIWKGHGALKRSGSSSMYGKIDNNVSSMALAHKPLIHKQNKEHHWTFIWVHWLSIFSLFTTTSQSWSKNSRTTKLVFQKLVLHWLSQCYIFFLPSYTCWTSLFHLCFIMYMHYFMDMCFTYSFHFHFNMQCTCLSFTYLLHVFTMLWTWGLIIYKLVAIQ